MMKSKEQLGSLYAILSGFLYGFIGYFGLSAMNGHLSASTMLFWRFFIASLIILVLVIPKIKSVTDTWRSLFIAYISGVLYYGISTMLYFYSSEYIGSGLAMVIFFTYPVMVMLLNYFFYGQHIPQIYYLATFIILIGMALMVDMNEVAFDVLGIGLGLASAFFYACYMIASERNKMSPMMSTLMVCLGCMTTSLIVSCLGHTFTFPDTAMVWVNLFGIGIVATVVPILLMLYGLQYISSEKASILSVLEPVFVVIFGVLLLGEVLKPLHAVGIVFVLAGAMITLFSHKLSLAQLLGFFKKALAS